MGSTVFGARKVGHGYVHPTYGRQLGIHFPAGFERFFDEVSEWSAEPASPAEAPALSEAALRYGVRLLGPPT